MEWFELRFQADGPEPLPSGPWTNHHFENCHFEGLTFGEMDWRNTRFENCTFERCNLVGVRWTGARLHGVDFKECTVDRLRWSTLSPQFLNLSLHECQATGGDWSDLDLKGCKLIDSNLSACDFSGADARNVDWSGSKLTEVIFHRSDLREGDFRTAIEWNIDPQENRVRDARFASNNLEGLVGRMGIRLD